MAFVEEMRWWHWVAISLVLGALLGFLNSGGADTAVDHSSVSTVVFEAGLILRPWVDPQNPNHREPWLRNIVVHPIQEIPVGQGRTVKVQLVSFTRYQVPTPGHPSGQTTVEYVLAPYPYEPTPRRGPAGSTAAYPAVSLYYGQKGDTLDSLATKFYHKDMVPGIKAIIAANPPLREAKGMADLHIQTGHAYWIPWNPADNHNVNDFLKAADNFNRQQYGAAAVPVSFHYLWWENSKYTYQTWMIGTFLIVGVVWPAMLTVMIRGGLGKTKPEEYDLKRFKGGRDVATMPKPSVAQATVSDMQKLRDLEESLAANLKAGGAAPVVAVVEQPAVAVPEVKKLAGGPVEAVTAPAEPEEPKEYMGEFYPVVKPHGHTEKKD